MFVTPFTHGFRLPAYPFWHHWIRILLDNSYPLFYVFHIIRERLRLLFALNQADLQLDENRPAKEPSLYFTIPYIPIFSEQFRKRILRNHDTGVSYFGLNKLRNFLRVHKNIMPKDSCNVVYSLVQWLRCICRPD